MKINEPATVAELTAAFSRYETALVENDVSTLNEMFWNHPLTIRFGTFENLYGHDAIAAFRQARLAVKLVRRLKNTVITTYGRNFGTSNTEFVRLDSGRAGRQSQTWIRTKRGWRIVASHASWFTPPAMAPMPAG
jgi:hypothetical protein